MNNTEAIMTRQEAIETINPLKSKYEKSNLTGRDILNQFNDNELIAYIALATFAFGRSWVDSLDNARIHVQDRSKAIRLFGTQDQDLLGAR